MNLVLPEMGEGIIEATVSRWLIEPGDLVERLDPVVEVETDKVTTEVVADAAGTLVKIFIEEGETVSVGTVLAEFAPRSEPAGPLPTSVVAAEVEGREKRVEGKGVVSDQLTVIRKSSHANGSEPAIVNPKSKIENSQRVSRVALKASPVVARMAAEHELDLSVIAGSGKHGRITKRDVVAFMREGEKEKGTSNKYEVESKKPVISAMPSLQTSNFTLHTLSPMRRAIADHMVESVRTSPHATTIHEVDFSAVMTHRKAHKAEFAEKGVNLTITAYIMQAVAQALSENSMVNSSWTAEGIAVHQEINIGMATAVQGGAGLVVPVIKHAADFNLLGMARVVTELTHKARENKLTAADMQGGTFTVTNHGVSGSLFATPIINQPQAGILGIGAIKKQVVVIEDEFGNDATAIRPMAYLSCSFDHRILDGVSADGFVAAVVSHVQNWK